MASRFSKQAELYARYRPDYPKALYDFIFDHLAARDKAWDCATGSGQVATYLADYFDEVIATDISDEQLSHAPQKSNILYSVAAAEDSGLPADTFDLITVAQAIHWFDFEQFYAEVNRVAKDKALLAVIGYGMVCINDEADPIIDALYEEAFGAYYNKNRTYLDNEYQTIPFPFGEIPSPSFQNDYQWSLDQLEGYFNSWSAVQKMKFDQGYNPVNDTITKLSNVLADTQHISVTFPVYLRLGKIGK